MNLPTTNNVWIIFFLGGILCIYISISKMESHNFEQMTYITELGTSSSELEQLLKNFDIEIEVIDNKIERINNSITLSSKEKIESLQLAIDEREKLVAVYKLKSNIIIAKSDKLEESYSFSQESWNDIKNIFRVLYYLGIGISLLGLVFLIRLQFIRDNLLESELIKSKVTKPNCQSCNMKLIEDIKFDGKSNYCSYCVTNNEFNHNLSLQEFEKMVYEKLKEKGFTDNEINRKLVKLQFLDRWKKKFDWLEIFS